MGRRKKKKLKLNTRTHYFALHPILTVDDASFIEKLIIIIEETTGHTEQLMESLLVKLRVSAKFDFSSLALKHADNLCQGAGACRRFNGL